MLSARRRKERCRRGGNVVSEEEKREMPKRRNVVSEEERREMPKRRNVVSEEERREMPKGKKGRGRVGGEAVRVLRCFVSWLCVAMWLFGGVGGACVG